MYINNLNTKIYVYNVTVIKHMFQYIIYVMSEEIEFCKEKLGLLFQGKELVHFHVCIGLLPRV